MINNRKPPEIANIIYEILSNFFFDIESYWTIQKYYQTLDINDLSRPLWILLSNNCLMMATVEWCKVFGSEHNNITHYTKCIDTLNGIEGTVQEMKEFRDKYISHYDMYDKPVPFMENAVEIVKKFDQVMLQKYDSINQVTTSDYIANVQKDVELRLKLIVSKDSKE